MILKMETDYLLFNQLYEDVIAAIENAGADVNAIDEDGRASLMYASGYNTNPEINSNPIFPC
jgi:ankyrin repeat protein